MPLTFRIEHHHFHHNPNEEGALMAVSRQFQAQLDRLSQLISSDKSNQAAEIAKAVQAQAEADQAAIQAAHDAAQEQVQQLTAANQELTDELNALKATLDGAGAPPAADDPTVVQPTEPASTVTSGTGNDTISGGTATDTVAPETPAAAPQTAQDGSSPTA